MASGDFDRHICYATGDRKWSSGESRIESYIRICIGGQQNCDLSGESGISTVKDSGLPNSVAVFVRHDFGGSLKRKP